MSEPIWDAGLQPERTGLAWRRVGLSLIGVGLLLPKLAWDELGTWVLPAVVVALGSAALLHFLAGRRYRAEVASLLTTGALPTDGRLPLLVTVATLGLGIAAAGYVF